MVVWSFTLAIKGQLRLVGMLAIWVLFVGHLAKAADYVMAIDVSGSMLWNKAGERIQEGSAQTSRLEIVRPALGNYVASLPDDSRLYLISFNSGIVSEREFLFSRAGDREKAASWVNALAPPRDSKTHLFATIRRALLKAREYAASSEEGWVNVRVITDGENDHPGSDLTLQEVLDGFPEIPKGLMLPDLILLGSLKAEFMAPVNAEADKGRVNPIVDPNFEDPFPPVIKWAPDPAVAGQEVTFFDASKSAFQSHSWSVNEQAAGEGKTIKHTFTEPGRYVVRLSVERKSGSRDRAQAVVTVGTSPIKADFHVPSEVVAGRQAEFVDRSTGEVETRRWTVDGKPAGSDRDLSFTFESEGSHEVVLEIAGKNDQKDTASRTVEVLPPPPPPSKPEAGIRMVGEVFKVGEPVQFMDQSSGLIEGHSWDFAGEGTSSEKNPIHAFESAGDRTVTLTVKGPGGEDQTSVQVQVLPPGPTIKVSADPEKGTVPFDVRFSAEIDGDYESILWNFGDGDTSAEVNPVHTFTQPGDYAPSAQLTFKGAEGPGTITSAALSVRAKAPLSPLAKLLIALGALLALWVLVIVPFFLKPFYSLAEKRGGMEFRLKPERGSPTSMGQVYRSHGGTNWLWPRRHARVGSESKDDVRLPAGGSATLAVIRRVPFQQRFVLIPTGPGAIKQRKASLRLGERTISEIDIAGATTLADGDEFAFKAVNARWEEKA